MKKWWIAIALAAAFGVVKDCQAELEASLSGMILIGGAEHDEKLIAGAARQALQEREIDPKLWGPFFDGLVVERQPGKRKICGYLTAEDGEMFKGCFISRDGKASIWYANLTPSGLRARTLLHEFRHAVGWSFFKDRGIDDDGKPVQ